MVSGVSVDAPADRVALRQYRDPNDSTMRLLTLLATHHQQEGERRKPQLFTLED
jgi:hypothetical protein